MMNKLYHCICAVLAFCGTAQAQNITLDWVRTEAYQTENANAVFTLENGSDDIISGILNIWVDVNNQIHATALNRRDQAGQMLQDTVFDNNSYLDYQLKGFLPKNGETYYCLSYQNNDLVFEKLGTSGQLLWQQTLPRASLFFTHDRNLRGDNWVIDDSLNNRMLWSYAQWDPSFQTKSIGILATDNATGAISIVDTISYSGPNAYLSFPFEIRRDNNNHVYLNLMDEDGSVKVALLDNGQLVTEAIIDSAGLRDYGQAMRIVGNTMFVTSQVEVNNNYRTSKLSIYAIDAAGHLTLTATHYLSDTQSYVAGIKPAGNYCYVFTSGYQNIGSPSLVPVIWKYDNTGTLVSTFTLPNFTGKFIFDLAVTSKAMYCSMYTPGFDQLEVLQPVTGAHLTSYNLLNEFSAGANDGAFQVEAISPTVTTDKIIVAGNKWINSQLFARLSKYSYSGGENGIASEEQSGWISFYPNPANDNIWLNLDGRVTAEVFDMQGRLLLSQECSDSRQPLNLSQLNNGVFVLRVHDETRVAVNRFIKK